VILGSVSVTDSDSDIVAKNENVADLVMSVSLSDPVLDTVEDSMADSVTVGVSLTEIVRRFVGLGESESSLVGVGKVGLGDSVSDEAFDSEVVIVRERVSRERVKLADRLMSKVMVLERLRISVSVPEIDLERCRGDGVSESLGVWLFVEDMLSVTESERVATASAGTADNARAQAARLAIKTNVALSYNKVVELLLRYAVRPSLPAPQARRSIRI
jgi:hypothetical protein